MNVLVVHNFYQQSGGEDQVFEAEVSQLRRSGLNVSTYTVSNEAIDDAGKLRVAAQTVWNPQSARALAKIVRSDEIDVVHFHNTFPLISPAAYAAVRSEGAAVVQTLHNYRLVCANGLLFRDGHVCEDCVGRFLPTPAIRHACYRDSRAGSAVVATMLATHRALGTYRRDVDMYLTLTDFARAKLIESGLPADRMLVKPNFLSDDPGVGTGDGGYALFVGRLSPEKGLDTLLAAWRRLGQDLPLRIVGDGPLEEDVRRAALEVPGVTLLGRQQRAGVLELMKGARLLVFPSECYETFGMTVVEAFAAGLPVVASDIGSAGSLVDPGVTGLRFRSGDADDLVRQVHALLGDADAHARMRREARRTFETLYTPEVGVRKLRDVYEQVVSSRGRRLGRVPHATT
ncbi:glycosyltransferase family 4 protein [Deinococcus pimensis]|uniref:glycosyltransferase family 4 protein n=1 Tax=Deinococcus pimensis TaxID=309888 RepID=UPI0004ADC6AC|nr:glycosyltransferase family 4 protein [Deinococcus pimensis]